MKSRLSQILDVGTRRRFRGTRTFISKYPCVGIITGTSPAPSLQVGLSGRLGGSGRTNHSPGDDFYERLGPVWGQGLRGICPALGHRPGLGPVSTETKEKTGSLVRSQRSTHFVLGWHYEYHPTLVVPTLFRDLPGYGTSSCRFGETSVYEVT